MSLPVTIHEIPFFRLLIPLTAGIILQVIFDVLPPSFAIVLFPVIAFFSIFITYFLSAKWQYRWVFGVSLNAFLVACGMFLAVNFSYDNTLVKDKDFNVIVRLLDNPQQRTRSVRAKCEIAGVLVNNQFQTSNENILLYFRLSDSLAQKLKYGDIIATRISLREFDEPSNPFQFNVKRYMKQECIRFSSFVNPESWIHCGHRSNSVVNISLRLRDGMVNLFKKYNIDGQELAVVSALTIGYRELLDDELQKVYSATGAMHILSVSGLHVGILYFLLAFILGFLPSRRYSAPIKLLVSLFFLWFFALLTGLSPSVCRSALMFSVIAISQGFGIRTNIINTLAVAAFVLLVSNPYNLLNVGFQLSFLAVLSIVVFYPFIYSLLYFKFKPIDYIWSLVAVSIAAQIGTFPLNAAYFSQFPNYFILTNLIAIPLSTLILYFAVLLLVVAPFSFLAVWVGKLLNGLLLLLNGGLEWVEQLPGALTSAIHITSIQLILLVIALILLTMFLHSYRMLYLQFILSILILVLGLTIWHKLNISQSELVVFDVPRKSTICIRKNGVANFILIDTLLNDPIKENGFYLSGFINHETYAGQYSYKLLNSSIKSNYSEHGSVFMQGKSGITLVNLNNLVFAIPYNDSVKFLQASQVTDVDLLLINNYFSEKMLKFIKPRLVVIDGTIPQWKLNKLMVMFVEQRIKVYNINSNGAYRMLIK